MWGACIVELLWYKILNDWQFKKEEGLDVGLVLLSVMVNWLIIFFFIVRLLLLDLQLKFPGAYFFQFYYLSAYLKVLTTCCFIVHLLRSCGLSFFVCLGCNGWCLVGWLSCWSVGMGTFSKGVQVSFGGLPCCVLCGLFGRSGISELLRIWNGARQSWSWFFVWPVWLDGCTSIPFPFLFLRFI